MVAGLRALATMCWHCGVELLTLRPLCQGVMFTPDMRHAVGMCNTWTCRHDAHKLQCLGEIMWNSIYVVCWCDSCMRLHIYHYYILLTVLIMNKCLGFVVLTSFSVITYVYICFPTIKKSDGQIISHVYVHPLDKWHPPWCILYMIY
jgi:hypothetical protein